MSSQEFQQIILPLKNKLFRFALSFLTNQADAKDVVQDVMMKAWEVIDDPSDFGSPEAWCMTATRNKCLDRLKKKGRQYDELSAHYDLSTREADPHQVTEARESLHTFQQIVSCLPEKQQTVIQMRDVEEYSYKEIAEIMDISMSHVKILLHRARKQVQQQMKRIHHHGISYPQSAR